MTFNIRASSSMTRICFLPEVIPGIFAISRISGISVTSGTSVFGGNVSLKARSAFFNSSAIGSCIRFFCFKKTFMRCSITAAVKGRCSIKSATLTAAFVNLSQSAASPMIISGSCPASLLFIDIIFVMSSTGSSCKQ